MPKLAITTCYSCSHSTLEITEVLPKDIPSDQAIPELPFVPGTRERYNLEQVSTSQCDLCQFKSMAKSNQDILVTQDYVCGHELTSFVGEVINTTGLEREHVGALDISSGDACPACYFRMHNVEFECGHRFQRLEAMRAPAKGDRKALPSSEKVERKCPKCEMKGEAGRKAQHLSGTNAEDECVPNAGMNETNRNVIAGGEEQERRKTRWWKQLCKCKRKKKTLLKLKKSKPGRATNNGDRNASPGKASTEYGLVDGLADCIGCALGLALCVAQHLPY